MDTPTSTGAAALATISGKPPKVAREVAEDDFVRLCTARHIELDDSDWSDEDKESFKVIRNHIVKLIAGGRVTVAGDGAPSFTSIGGQGFTFRKATGAALISMDGAKSNTAKMFTAFAEMTGVNVGEFGKLELADVNHLSSLYSLFFQRASSI
jgi:hypothetical protein